MAVQAGRLLHRIADFFNGISRLVSTVIDLCSGERMFQHPVLEEAHQLLDIDARLDGVLPAGIKKVALLLPPVQAGHVAVLPFAINDAWPHDGQLPGRITGLPDLVDFFCHQLADPIRRVGRRQSLLRLKVLRRTIGCNGAGEQDLPDAVFFRKCGHIFRAPDICFKIGFFRVAGGAVDRCQIKDHILRGRNELKIDGLAHIQPDILHPIVLFHNARHHALFPRHHKIQVVDHVAGSDALLQQQMNEMGADKTRSTKKNIIHFAPFRSNTTPTVLNSR